MSRRVEHPLDGVAVAWRTLEAPSHAERPDGTSKWVNELILVNPDGCASTTYTSAGSSRATSCALPRPNPRPANRRFDTERTGRRRRRTDLRLHVIIDYRGSDNRMRPACLSCTGSNAFPISVLTGGATTGDNEGMVHGSDTVAYRLWPPIAIGAPLLVGGLVTLLGGDPIHLGAWRVALGWALVLFFVGCNGWSLWLFRRHETGLLPGQATHAIIEAGPYRLSRNPLYVGLLALYLGLALLAPTFWGLVLFPAAVLLILWGAILPEERFLHERFGAAYDDYTKRVRRWL